MKRRLLFAVLIALLVPEAALPWAQMQRPGADGNPVALSWSTSSFPYSVCRDGSDDFSFDALAKIARASFETWQSADCSYFEFVETEPAETDETAFHGSYGNANVISWRETEEDWPASASVIGLTTVSFDKRTGEILDADIEFNGAWAVFADSDSYPVGGELWDLRSVFTHEIGHTIGLDESDDPEATMFGTAFPGETIKRDLSTDDLAGLCAIYPIENDPGIDGEPHCGLQLDGQNDGCEGTFDDGGCVCAAPGGRPTTSLLERTIAAFF